MHEAEAMGDTAEAITPILTQACGSLSSFISLLLVCERFPFPVLNNPSSKWAVMCVSRISSTQRG